MGSSDTEILIDPAKFDHLASRGNGIRFLIGLRRGLENDMDFNKIIVLLITMRLGMFL